MSNKKRSEKKRGILEAVNSLAFPPIIEDNISI